MRKQYWWGMVDCIMVDPHRDGETFNIASSDIPLKKTDLVAGKCELVPPRDRTTVAVNVIDMLGEEVLVTKDISR